MNFLLSNQHRSQLVLYALITLASSSPLSTHQQTRTEVFEAISKKFVMLPAPEPIKVIGVAPETITSTPDQTSTTTQSTTMTNRATNTDPTDTDCKTPTTNVECETLTAETRTTPDYNDTRIVKYWIEGLDERTEIVHKLDDDGGITDLDAPAIAAEAPTILSIRAMYQAGDPDLIDTSANTGKGEEAGGRQMSGASRANPSKHVAFMSLALSCVFFPMNQIRL